MRYTDKLVGNTKAFLGFIFQNGFYIPNTALEEDIRNFSLYQPQKVLAIFRKPVDIGQYQELCYIAKGGCQYHCLTQKYKKVFEATYGWSYDE